MLRSQATPKSQVPQPSPPAAAGSALCPFHTLVLIPRFNPSCRTEAREDPWPSRGWHSAVWEPSPQTAGSLLGAAAPSVERAGGLGACAEWSLCLRLPVPSLCILLPTHGAQCSRRLSSPPCSPSPSAWTICIVCRRAVCEGFRGLSPRVPCVCDTSQEMTQVTE